MKSLKGMAEEYSEAMQTIDRLRTKLYGEIIKYLIDNSWNPTGCTEAGISKEFDMPRSTIRPILEELVSNGILECADLERLKPYLVKGLGKAIDDGYVDFDKQEVQSIFSPKEAEDGSDVFMASPGIGGISENGKHKYRWLGPGHKYGLQTLVGRFISFLPPSPLEEAIEKLSSSEEFKGSELYAPEYAMFETFFHGWSVLGEKADDLVIQMGLKEKYTEEEARDILATAFERKIEFALNRLSVFSRILEDEGYGSISGMIPRYGYDGPYRVGEGKEVETPIRFKKSYVWATTQALRQGCKIAQKLKIPSKNLIQKAIELSDILDRAIEKEYKGRKEDGPLEDWYAKQTKS